MNKAKREASDGEVLRQARRFSGVRWIPTKLNRPHEVKAEPQSGPVDAEVSEIKEGVHERVPYVLRQMPGESVIRPRRSQMILGCTSQLFDHDNPPERTEAESQALIAEIFAD